jgi:ABC-type dipeptide/oligopeptide/nickel transport system permease component
MLSLFLRRLLATLPTLLVVVTLVFVLMRLAPGNPFSSERDLPPQVLHEMEARYHLNGTLWEQYISYLSDVLHGDLRDSTKYVNRSVNEILAQMLPVSLLLGGTAFLLVMGIGLSLGAWAAVHRGQAEDRLAMMLALLGISIPGFVLAPVLVLVFALWLPLFPVAGWGSWDQVLLPALCLALPFAASVARLTRASLLEVLHQDFIRTARAKGLPESKILVHHALRLALLPVLSYAGPLAANLLTGSIVVETFFRIPGLGPFFVNSVLNRDLFVVSGVVLVYSVLLILLNLLSELAQAALDRRIRLG